jgi:DNA-binding CsgD family transcriptional regulator
VGTLATPRSAPDSLSHPASALHRGGAGRLLRRLSPAAGRRGDLPLRVAPCRLLARTKPISAHKSRCAPLSIWIAWEISLNGILDLTRTPEEWVETLSHLARGQAAWPSDLMDQAIAFDRAWGRRLRRLSARDWRRWRDLAAGLPPKALAARWGLSPAGVSRYLRRLADRLGVPGPEDLLGWGFALGIWVGPPGAPRLAPPLQAWRLLRAAGDPSVVKNWNICISKP